MKKIYSKVKKNKLLHLVVSPKDFKKKIQEFVPSNNFIQCLGLKFNKNKKFDPHRHVWKSGKSKSITQESWCVIKGSARVNFYDIDNKLISSVILKAGSASFTFEGGHGYEILEKDTLVYEYKTGPYKENFNDKVYI